MATVVDGMAQGVMALTVTINTTGAHGGDHIIAIMCAMSDRRR
ncbi:MAG: hypothetical protein QME75_08940 [Deltaproteobacteria bacterium]|nr:hypothetical protein [Deltaproteobacteria bacterium]